MYERMYVCMYVLFELQVSSSSCGWASHKGRPAINYHWNKLKSKNYNEFEEIPSNGVTANAKDAQMKQNKTKWLINVNMFYFPFSPSFWTPYIGFFRNFLLEQKWHSSIGKCRKFYDGPYENLFKFGYNLNMKSKYLIKEKYFLVNH